MESYTEKFLEMLKEANQYQSTGRNCLVASQEDYFLPSFTLSDAEEKRLNQALSRFWCVVQQSKLLCTFVDDKHTLEYFLFWLCKNFNNDDFQNPTKQVERFTDFILDTSFSNFSKQHLLGTIQDENGKAYRIATRRCEESRGFETPFLLKNYIGNQHMMMELPILRYGISRKTAYLYAIQRKKVYESCHGTDEINHLLNKINHATHLNKHSSRHVPSSMVASLAINLGMFYQAGLRKVEAIDYMPRRFAHFHGIVTEEDREQVQYRATNSFLYACMRMSYQFDGIVTDYYPNEIDSNLHFHMESKVHSENELLDALFQLGCNLENEGQLNFVLSKK